MRCRLTLFLAVALALAFMGRTCAESPSVDAVARDKLQQGIRQGVPLFNEGDAAGCYRIYDKSLFDIQRLLVARPVLKDVMSRARLDAAGLSADRDKAWRLRQFIDSASETLAKETPEPREATRVRILLVIDTTARQRERGRDRLRSLLLSALRQQSLPCTLNVLEGDAITARNVLEYYRTLKTGPDEALFFYYVGHGEISRSRGQLLCLKDRSFFRAELRSAMLQRNPRLAVILTDACSTGINRGEKTPAEGSAVPAQSMPHMRGSGSVLRDLLFRHSGLVVISSAEPGTPAWAGPEQGVSPFNTALCTLLAAPSTRFDKNNDGFVEWREFFPQLRDETSRVAQSIKKTQKPQSYFLGQPFQGK
jgi:hypothetical protein